MASLTQVSIGARKSIRWGIYLSILIFIGRFALIYTLGIYRNLFPAPPPPPTVLFGRLTKLPFPQREGLPQLQYKLETPDFSLPTLPPSVSVYYMPKAQNTLLSFETAKNKAAGLGYTSEPTEITQTTYRFRHPTHPVTLEMDIVFGTFSISYNLSSDPEPLDRQPPAPTSAEAIARNVLTSASSSPKDLVGPVTPEFLRVDSQGLSTVVSLSEANLIKVNLFRQDFEGLPAKTADPKTANVWFILSGEGDRAKQTVASEFHYFPIDQQQVSTYPIKTATLAFEELKAGKGFIASLGQNQTGNVTIRRVSLAYYDPGIYFEYYEPIVVFEGDGGFVAYVPAITDEYYGE